MADVSMVVGLGFGDEGKGSVVDFLARKHESTVVVRHNGGAQAAHHVALTDGRQHTFAQFGSGTFVPGCRTHLSAYMLVNPIFMMREEVHLKEVGVTDAFERTTISRAALITNPFQVASNRLKEMARAGGRHGSCGMGIGETMADFATHPEDAILASDLASPETLRNKLGISQGRKHDELCGLDTSTMTPAMWREWELLTDTTVVNACVDRYKAFAKLVRIVDGNYLPDLFRGDGSIIFEGAQGVLLDQDYGFFPYVTRSSTTLKNALTLLDGFEGYCDVKKFGILRAYSTRHGAGPFPTEDTSLNLPDTHNGTGPWQESFRVGPLDLVLTRYALDAVGGVDEIVMTNVDRLRKGVRHKVCSNYDGGDLLDDYLGGKHPFFAVHNGLIDGLRVPMGQDPETLATRTRFTKALSEVTAEDDYDFLDPEELVAHVADRLRTPINICSYGPTAEDKKPRC